MREIRRDVEQITDCYEIEQTRGNHIRIRIFGPHGSRFIIAPKTASDHRARRNMRADIVRKAREVGVFCRPNAK